jgi:alpha-tubulin suppressor-like RCC1 family protein
MMGKRWITVSAGLYHTCAVKDDHFLLCWGRNDSGQLGDGTTVHKNIPTLVGMDMNWGSVSAGEAHTCGVRTTGTLWCWGDNFYGKLGIGFCGW